MITLAEVDCCPDWGTAALPVPDLIEETERVTKVLTAGTSGA